MSSTLIIFIFVLITLILYIKYQDYENYLLDPFITIYPQGDLNNRLEITLAYLYKANTENKKLRVIWIKDDECSEYFNNLFESINNIQFIYTDTIPDNEIDFITRFTPEIDYIKYKYYKYLKPIPSIQDNINNVKNKLISNNTEYVSCYIKKADIYTIKKYFGNNYVINYNEIYISFINNNSNNLNIYLVTDDENTEEQFLNLFGNRLIYRKILKVNNVIKYSPQDLVEDLYLCANSTYFKGTPWNSETHTINELRKIIN